MMLHAAKSGWKKKQCKKGRGEGEGRKTKDCVVRVEKCCARESGGAYAALPLLLDKVQ